MLNVVTNNASNAATSNTTASPSGTPVMDGQATGGGPGSVPRRLVTDIGNQKCGQGAGVDTPAYRMIEGTVASAEPFTGKAAAVWTRV